MNIGRGWVDWKDRGKTDKVKKNRAGQAAFDPPLHPSSPLGGVAIRSANFDRVREEGGTHHPGFGDSSYDSLNSIQRREDERGTCSILREQSNTGDGRCREIGG